ncbi:MAG: MFS transporter, partial [Flavobacterium psychrophilum]
FLKKEKTAIAHLWHTIKQKKHRIGFTSTALLSIGGFMMMPFGSAFAVNNLGITENQLPMLFMVSGLSSLIILPMIGKLSDKISKLKIFTVASLWMMAMCVVYTNLSITPFLVVILINVLMMMGVMSRMIPSQALTSAIPEPQDRGAFMSINTSLQQIAGGIASIAAGLIVTSKGKGQPLEHYDMVAYVIVVISLISIWLMGRVNKIVEAKATKLPTSAPVMEH